MSKHLNKEKLKVEILTHLSRQGASDAATLCQLFQISQPSLSRMLAQLTAEVIVISKGKNTRYAAKRIIATVDFPLPIYEILPDGTSLRLGNLQAIQPQGYFFQAELETIASAVYADLPYFLNDLRPGGFLGRLIPFYNENSYLPKNILLWSAENCLQYLSAQGWDTIGNLILGNQAFQLYLEKGQNPVYLSSRAKNKSYTELAENILSHGMPGSSAGGEQPKFLTLVSPTNKHLLVKFSPPTEDKLGRRVSDLLICEHLALQTLKKSKLKASDSTVYLANKRCFLEVTRFDRIGQYGRRGVISLGTLDAEFHGSLDSWSKISVALAEKKIIPQELVAEIYLREYFGNLIANNDMHAFNLSFFTQNLKITDLTPVYDMAPVLFSPRNNQLLEQEFSPRLPVPEHYEIWNKANQLAIEFWEAVQKDARISPDFKKIAKSCLKKILAAKNLAERMPKKRLGR